MIFTGIEILFFMLGVIFTLSVGGLYNINKRFKLSGLTWSLLGIGLFLFLFAVAWSASSVLEGEPRAASMGVVVFGIPSLLLITLGMRLVLKKNRDSHVCD